MAVAIHPKSTKSAPNAGNPGRFAPVLEAPDWGGRVAEAPEARSGRRSEAPDAGEGRMNTLEHEFTHGRSQS